MNFRTWSNAFFAVPLGMAIHFHVWLTIFLLPPAIVASFLYHRSGER